MILFTIIFLVSHSHLEEICTGQKFEIPAFVDRIVFVLEIFLVYRFLMRARDSYVRRSTTMSNKDSTK